MIHHRLAKKACLLMLVCAFLVMIANVPHVLCYPSAGSDYTAHTTATIELTIYGPQGFTENITAEGPTTVSRSNPYDPGDGHIKIDTEIVSMTLTGFAPNIGSFKIIESPSKASTGAIRQQVAGQDFPADSFFDVYIEIETLLPYPLGTLHNDDPKHMSAVIYTIPPYGSTYEGPTTVYLYDESDSLVGAMLATTHLVDTGVGGVVVPVDRLGLLAPYIGLASTIMIGVVATAVYFRRVKRRREKQRAQ